MSEESNEFALQQYTNPLSLQSSILTRLEQDVLDGREVPDGNNVYTHLLEYATTFIANYARKTVNAFQDLYPYRANTTQSLHRHMSDFDYIGLYATPAKTKVRLLLSRSYLINHCIVDESPILSTSKDGVDAASVCVGKLTIPSSTTFTLGTTQFRIHYPIDIYVRKVYKVVQNANHVSTVEVDYANCTFSAQFDLTNESPITSIETNILETDCYSRDGLEVVSIIIPVEQFDINVQTDDSTGMIGYARDFDYTGRFYAIRVLQLTDSSWKDLCQTLSTIGYDVKTPTAIISVLSDLNKVRVEIPQIYYTEKLISPRLKIVIYTTEGEIRLDTSTYTSDQFMVTFSPLGKETLSEHSTALAHVPYVKLQPTSPRIVGGTNGISFEDLRYRVIHNIESNRLITPEDVKSYFVDMGFDVERFIDNITNRIFIARKKLYDINGVQIGTCSGIVPISWSMLSYDVKDTEYVSKNYSRSIKPMSENQFIILPTARYLLSESRQTFKMLTDDEIDDIENLGVKNRISYYNENVVTYSPFHIRLDIFGDRPLASSYDLLHPKITKLQFKSPIDVIPAENTTVPSQLTVLSCAITHKEFGTEGYRINFELYQTEDISMVVPEIGATNEVKNIALMLMTYTDSGDAVYILGDYIGRTEATGRLNYRFDLNTTYQIDENDNLYISNLKSLSTGTYGAYVKMNPDTAKWYMLYFIRDTSLPYDNFSDPMPAYMHPTEIKNHFVWLATQSMLIKFGEPINMIHNNIAITLDDNMFEECGYTEFATFDENIYQRYAIGDVLTKDGRPYTVQEGDAYIDMVKYPLEVKYSAGDMVVDESKRSNVRCYTTPVLTFFRKKRPYESSDPTISGSTNFELVNRPGGNAKFTDVWNYISDDEEISGSIKVVSGFLASIINPESDLHGCFVIESCTLNDLKTRSSFNGVIKPFESNSPFMFVTNASDDPSEPENTIEYEIEVNPLTHETETVLGRDMLGALYRKDFSVLRPEVLEVTKISQYPAIVKYLEEDKYTTSEIAKLCGVRVQDALNAKRLMFPWIKVQNAKNLQSLNLYLSQTPSAGGYAYVVQIDGDISALQFLTTEDGKFVIDPETGNWETCGHWPFDQQSRDPVCEVSGIVCDGGGFSLNENVSLVPVKTKPTDLVRINNLNKDEAEVVYNLEAIHVDAKYTQATTTPYVNFQSDITDQLYGYFTSLEAAKIRLLEKTDLFFEPINTLGFRSYNTYHNVTNVSLEYWLKLRIYVSATVESRNNMLTSLRNIIISVLDRISSNKDFSISIVISELKKELEGQILYLDYLGSSLPEDTLLHTSNSSAITLGHRLVLREDGDVDIDRELDIEWSVVS